MNVIMQKTGMFFFVFALIFFGSCRAKTGQEQTAPPTEEIQNVRFNEKGQRIITIGTWYNVFYVSRHKDIHDDPKLTDPESALLRLNKMRAIENKYNIILNYVNLSFNGVEESIKTSIPVGKPDVDIYEVDLQFGIPAVLKGYAVSLEEMGLGGSDVFMDQIAMKTLSIDGQNEHYLFAPSKGGSISAYVLAFNMDMIRKAGLENPQDLYDRGLWTWEKWRSHLKTLSRDINDDNVVDIYGYSGYWTHLLNNLLFSNNAAIAPGAEERLSSPEAKEVLEFISTIYNIDRTARPWDQSNWEINNRIYAEGLSGFWIGADWIFNEQGGAGLPFGIGVVPWPRGPHGSFKNNRHSQSQGNWYLIPKGAEDPRLIYDIMYDWVNWFDGNGELAQANEWSKTMYMTERNYSYAAMMADKPGYDIWDKLETGFSLVPLLLGVESPEEIVSHNKNRFQDALNNYFK
jgi:hypothetical protein